MFGTWSFLGREHFRQTLLSFGCGPDHGEGSSEWKIGGISSPVSCCTFTQARETLSQPKAGFTEALFNTVKTTVMLSLGTSHRTSGTVENLKSHWGPEGGETTLEWLHWHFWGLNWLSNITWASSTMTSNLLNYGKGSNSYQNYLHNSVSLEGNTALPLSLGKLNEFIVIAISEHGWIFVNDLERKTCHKLPGSFLVLQTIFVQDNERCMTWSF